MCGGEMGQHIDCGERGELGLPSANNPESALYLLQALIIAV